MAKSKDIYLSVLETLKGDILNGKYPFQSKLPSQEDLADELEVSRSTLRKVLAELEKDGFIESRKGSGSFVCNKNINRYIPFIVPKNDTTHRLAEILEGANSYFNKIGFSSLLIIKSDGHSQSERDVVSKLFDDGHRNFIIFPTSSVRSSLFYRKLQQQGCNFVFIDTLPEKIACDYVTSSNFLGGYEATKKLIELGHTDIAFCSIPKPKHANTINERYLGYLSALEENNIEPSKNSCFICENMSYEDFGNYIADNTTSTAIFASTDQLGIILVNKFAKLDKRPAIIGFDNIILAESFDLATINQNLYRIGQASAELLHKRIVNPSKEYEHLYVPISLVERASLNDGALSDKE